jgi:hypothetical protein
MWGTIDSMDGVGRATHGDKADFQCSPQHTVLGVIH